MVISVYWPPGLLSKNNLMSDLSFPLKLDINAVYLTVDDKIKLDISSYFRTNDIRILTPFLLLVYIRKKTDVKIFKYFKRCNIF